MDRLAGHKRQKRVERTECICVDRDVVMSLEELGSDAVGGYWAMPSIATADVPVGLTPSPVSDDLWRQHEVSLLAKIADANMVKDFRPITVLPVIYKLYSRVMYMLAETACNHLISAQFAFRKYHQAHDVVFIL